jgi:hypothetical protein
VEVTGVRLPSPTIMLEGEEMEEEAEESIPASDVT